MVPSSSPIDCPAPAALYLRLGFQETGCHYLDCYHYIDDNGMRSSGGLSRTTTVG